MKYVPITLIYLRLALGILLLIFSLLHLSNFSTVAISFIIIGLVSDIFDGIIARRLGISSEKLRRLDSGIDQAFWSLVAISAFIQYPEFFYGNYIKIIILFAAEAATYAFSFVKFKKEVATHAITSKIWTLLLFATLIELVATGDSGIIFQICFYTGIITRVENLAILVFLPTWTNDVPSVYHAYRLKQGKPIKRHKLFNG